MKNTKLFLLMVATLLCSFGVKAQITDVSQLSNDAVYFVSQPHHGKGATSWAIAEGGAALKSNVELGIESDVADLCQQFSFITNDGGSTYYLYHPAEGKYVNRDGSLSDTPQHRIYFKSGMYDATFVMHFGSGYYINVNGERKIVIDSWSTADGGNSCQITPAPQPDPNTQYNVTFYGWDGAVLKTETVKRYESATAPAAPKRGGYYFAGWSRGFDKVRSDLEVHAVYREFGMPITDISQLDDEYFYFMSLPHHSASGGTSWAVAEGGGVLKSSMELGLQPNSSDSRQQFILVTSDGGDTYYLRHFGEGKFINKDRSLSITPSDPIYFTKGAYDNTFACYFEAGNYIHVHSNSMGTWSGIDGGTSCAITPLGEYNLNAEYTVTFYDWDGMVLKTETVKWGESATAPAPSKRLGYSFIGWDKESAAVFSDMDIHANFARNVGGLNYAETYFISLPYHLNGATSWAIGPNATTLTSSTTLGAAPSAADPRQQFVFIYNNEGGYYLYHPASKKYVNKDCSLSDTPVDVIYLIEGAYSDTYVAYFDQTHYVNVNGNSYLVINSFSTPGEGNSFLIVPTNNSENVNAEYTVTFYDWDGTLLKTETVKWGQSPTPPASVRDGYVLVGWDINYEKVYADLVVYATYAMFDEVFPAAAPRAEHWYDFEGVGDKGFIGYINKYDGRGPYITSGISQQFKTLKSFSGYGNDFYYVEDLNGDGAMDIATSYDGDDASYISQGGSYVREDGMLIVPNFDINNDGRIDYLKACNSRSGYDVMIQNADGSFTEQPMYVMTSSEYAASFDPNKWHSLEKVEFTGFVVVGGWPSSVQFSGFAGATAPPRREEANAPQMRAQGINSIVSAPTRALDLNADGYVDLINEKDGILYYNVGNGQWVISSLDGSVVVADLNGDHIQDFIFPGEMLQVAIYRGGNDFEQQTLYENIQVDPEMYCYDFDRDGDVDILVTFSAPLNSTGYAYTMFFENDGTGQFVQLDEQDYGDNNLLFSNCQDLDGDGYYDMLAYRGAFKGSRGEVNCIDTEDLDIVWLRGKPNMTFADPEALVTIPKDADGNGKETAFKNNLEQQKISVEDVNNDGCMEVWVSFMAYSKIAIPSYRFEGTRNTAPAAPAKPELIYSNGILAINWGDGSDKQTATNDLTYALRVGTTPGGDDILRAHANADGTRRNFLDGNMSKYHNYTLDLTLRQPGTIYVSVQAIDAQHLGSAWSEEATVEHTALFADFRVSAVGAQSVAMSATAIAMPEGFTHTWVAEDGVCMGDGHKVEIIFNSAGEKIITHTVTRPDGVSMSAIETVNVMPNYTNGDEVMGTSLSALLCPGYSDDRNLMADYNMDGYWDAFGDYITAIIKGGDNYSFTQASGVWNTGLVYLEGGFWYDWDHNGAADFLFRSDASTYYYLPHNGTNNMKAKKEDTNLENFFKDISSHKHNLVDYTHDGNYDILYAENSKVGMYVRQSDGSYQIQNITSGVDKDLFSSMVSKSKYEQNSRVFHADINRDGFTDFCGISGGSNNPFKEMTVFVNKGNSKFETLVIPFEQQLFAGAPYQRLTDFESPHLVDMNNDGYYDIVAQRRDYAIYVMWNEKNKMFSAPEILPLGELQTFLEEVYTTIVDVDNNGYLDVVSIQHDLSLNDKGWGIYVHYFGTGGVIQQGFLLQGSDIIVSNRKPNLFKMPNHPWAMTLNRYYNNWNCLLPIHGPENEHPSAPTDVRAVQTAQGLLIEWNDAKDDATSGKQMRYNLSVKKKGASGEGAFFISPQNACNSNAAPIRNFNYITATQYLIPATVIPLGEYEIQLQAIDLQGDWSAFTEPLSVTVEEMPGIDGPTSTCTGESAQFTYVGTSTTATPVWDFDGGYVSSGSEFGPYRLLWNTPGTKTVTLTLDGKVTKHMIYVAKNEAEMTFPNKLFNNTTATLDIPEGVDVEWSMMPVDLTFGIKEYKPISDYPDVLKIEGNKLILKNTSTIKDWYIRAKMYDGNGCENTLSLARTINEQSDLPQITVVTANAEGHNVIRWNTGSFSGKVRILKETNRRDQYVEIGEVNLYECEYIDRSANTIMQGERYAIQLIPDEDIEGTIPMSTPHTTSHLTINRGLTSTMWNLIWSDYEGGSVVGYNILRGTSPDNLEEIGSVSASHHSYTDYVPDANAPYYAIEYILKDETSYSPGMDRVAARATGLKGQTNVVNSNMANALVYVEKMSILSATNKYATTEDNPSLALYPEIMPVAATLRSARWEIIDGADLATISSTGILTAKNPNRGGMVTVQATTVDGTNISATRTITIAPIGEMEPVTYNVTFYDWDGTVLKTEVVQQGESATAPANPTRTGYTFAGWDKAFSNVQGNLNVTATYTQNSVTEYTVKFCDWNGTVLKTQTVQQGQSATAPSNPTREGYTFTGWDKSFANVQSDLTVNAVYTKNSVEPDPGTGELSYTIQFNASANGWIEGAEWYNQTEKIAVYTSPLYRAQGAKVTKLRITVNRTAGNTKYFCLSELEFYDAGGNKIALSASNVASNADHNALNPTAPDGGGFAALFDGQTGTYFHSAWKNMPTSDHYLEVTLPNGGYDAFSFKMLSRARTIENGYVYDQSHTFPGVMVMSTSVELVVGNTPEPEPEPEYTVTFYDWNNTVLKTQKVKKGESATAPANPTREGYTFTGWDKAFTNVQSDLSVHAVYTQNSVEPKPELDNDAVYYVSQPYNGGTSWAIATGGSAMNINTKLGITADGADARQQFAFITNDGGKTHYLYHPAEMKYVNKDNTLSTTPRDPVYFLAGEYENTFVVYFDESHVINTNSTDGLIINRWGPLSGWGKADGGNSCLITRVEKSEPEPEPEPNPQPELDNETLYFVSQPYRGATSWAIAKGGTSLQCNGELGIAADKNDTRQQFAFISNDGGKTRYLYHPAERKYVNMDGLLSATPRDPVYFMPGAYENTFIVYFDIYHFINVNENPMVVINQWGPADNGWRGTADGGNSCLFTAVGRFDVTDIDFLHGEGTGQVQKVFENGEMFILLPDGSKYTMTGVRVK